MRDEGEGEGPSNVNPRARADSLILIPSRPSHHRSPTPPAVDPNADPAVSHAMRVHGESAR